MKMVDKKPVEVGWQPIGGEDLLYEMGLACLLLPECDGKPVWDKSEEKGVKALAQQYRATFRDNPRLSAEIGRQLANWAKGEPPARPIDELRAAGDAIAPQGMSALEKWFKESLSVAEKKLLKDVDLPKWKEIAAKAQAPAS